MNEVFVKARELGEALERSEEYVALQNAQEKITADETAGALLDEYGALQNEIGTLLQSEHTDTVAITRLNDRMIEIQQTLSENEVFVAYQQAQNDFSTLMSQVNQILSFMITGEVSEQEGGCAPEACASCPGCASRR